MGGDGVKTRLAGPDDVPTIAAVLSRAFYEDPFMTFALPDASSRLERAKGMFSAQLEMVFLHTAEIHTTPELAGAAIWTPPHPPEPPAPDDRRIGERMRDLFGDRLPVIGEALGEIYHHRPTGEQWYLDFLGTDPGRQGEGVGCSVLEPVLERCDATATPATLWTTTERNVRFYTNRGFEVTADLQPRVGPRVWWMRRTPR